MSNTTVITPVGRLSYPHLFTPQDPMNDGEEGKYGAAIVFEEGTDLSELKAAIAGAATSFFGAEQAKKLMAAGKLRLPLREDGEDKGYPENSVFFNARTKNRPSTVSRYIDPATGNMRVITDPSELYPGCYVKMQVSAYGYDVKGNKGVAFGLNHVLKYDDGERLDGRTNATSVFSTDAVAPKEVDLSDMDRPTHVDDDTDLSAFM